NRPRQLAFPRNLRDVGWLNDERNARVPQQFLAARRSRGKYQHWLSAPHGPAHGINELRRVVANAVFENHLHVFSDLAIVAQAQAGPRGPVDGFPARCFPRLLWNFAKILSLAPGSSPGMTLPSPRHPRRLPAVCARI